MNDIEILANKLRLVWLEVVACGQLFPRLEWSQLLDYQKMNWLCVAREAGRRRDVTDVDYLAGELYVAYIKSMAGSCTTDRLSSSTPWQQRPWLAVARACIDGFVFN